MEETASLDDGPAERSGEDAGKTRAGMDAGSRVALIYTTFPSKGEARKAGRELVEKGLAACVNIFPKMVSIYEWKGEIEETREAAMLIKTARTRADEVLAEVKRLHPYSLPARLVLAVDGGGSDFLEWICNQSHDTAP
jgi:periplasmic divalent cation tolerance protein